MTSSTTASRPEDSASVSRTSTIRPGSKPWTASRIDGNAVGELGLTRAVMVRCSLCWSASSCRPRQRYPRSALSAVLPTVQTVLSASMTPKPGWLAPRLVPRQSTGRRQAVSPTVRSRPGRLNSSRPDRSTPRAGPRRSGSAEPRCPRRTHLFLACSCADADVINTLMTSARTTSGAWRQTVFRAAY